MLGTVSRQSFPLLVARTQRDFPRPQKPEKSRTLDDKLNRSNLSNKPRELSQYQNHLFSLRSFFSLFRAQFICEIICWRQDNENVNSRSRVKTQSTFAKNGQSDAKN